MKMPLNSFTLRMPPRRELSHNHFDAERCERSITNLNLVDLQINSNKIRRMPIFVGLPLLETLKLADNEIKEISEDALKAVPTLVHLDLSRNSIHALAPNSFFAGNSLKIV